MTEWIVSSSVLIVAVLLIRRLLRGKVSPRIQYALWAIVLLRLLMPFSLFDSDMSIQNLQEEAMSRPEVQQVQQVINRPIVQQTTVQTPQTQEPQQSQNQAPVIPQNPVGQGSVVQNPSQTPSEPEPTSSLTLADLALYIWLGGMAVMALWMAACNIHFSRRLKQNRRALDIPACLLPVYRTDAVEMPCLFGLFHPAIYLTEEAAEDPLVQHYVLTHEMTHYRQLDHVWSVLRTVALTIHWYNPLVWLAFRASRQDCEMACDEGTLKQLGEEHRGDYGRTLISLAAQPRLRSAMVTATTLSDGKKAIRERIVILMKNPNTALITLVCLILCCAIIVGCTFTGAKDPTEKPDVTDPTETTEPTETTNPTEAIVPTEPIPQEILDMFRYGNPEYRWLFMSTSCIFEDPSQIDLYVVLHNGFEDSAQWNDFTGEEQMIVSEQFIGGVYTDVDRLPVTQIDQMLRKYFGVTFEDVRMSDLFAYYDKTDSYYQQHGDVYIPEITIDVVEVLDDTHLRVYYTHAQHSIAAAFEQYPMGKYINGASMVMDLELVNGIWQPRSNQVVKTNAPLYSYETLGELLSDRLYDPRQGDAFGVFRLTELDTGTTYHALRAKIFDFTHSKLILDWYSAVARDYSLYYDDTIMVQVESLDGSFYVQFHDGKDADWVYISECDKFVPLIPNPNNASTNDPASLIQHTLYTDYDVFLEGGHHIPNFGNGDPASAVEILTKQIPAYFRRTAERSKTGYISYESVEISNVYWKLNEDGTIYFQANLTYTPDTAYPYETMISCNLIRLEDGYWYREIDIDWLPVGRALPSAIEVPWEVAEQVTMSYEEYFAQIRPYSLEEGNIISGRSFDGYSVLYGTDCLQVVKGMNTPVLTVPNVDTTIDWKDCDSRWIYGVRNGQELVRISYAGGAALPLCNVAEVFGGGYGIAPNVYLADGAALYFTVCSENGSAVCRLYLPEMRLDIMAQTENPELWGAEPVSNHEVTWYEENLEFKKLMRSIEADPPEQYIVGNGQLVDDLESWVSRDYEIPRGYNHYVNTATGETYTLPSFGNYYSVRTQAQRDQNGDAWWNDFRTP